MRLLLLTPLVISNAAAVTAAIAVAVAAVSIAAASAIGAAASIAAVASATGAASATGDDCCDFSDRPVGALQSRSQELCIVCTNWSRTMIPWPGGSVCVEASAV